MMDCPECNGEGRIETLIGLTYDGDQRWHIQSCEHCDGTGKVEMKLQKRYIRLYDQDKTLPNCKEPIMAAWYDTYRLEIRYELPEIDLSQILMPDDNANEPNGVGLED
jgi:hypothetical protein